MNIQIFQTIYAAVLHICAVIAVVVLLALGKGDQNALMVALGGLLGFAVGVPLSVNPPSSQKPVAQATPPPS